MRIDYVGGEGRLFYVYERRRLQHSNAVITFTFVPCCDWFKKSIPPVHMKSDGKHVAPSSHVLFFKTHRDTEGWGNGCFLIMANSTILEALSKESRFLRNETQINYLMIVAFFRQLISPKIFASINHSCMHRFVLKFQITTIQTCIRLAKQRICLRPS